MLKKLVLFGSLDLFLVLFLIQIQNYGTQGRERDHNGYEIHRVYSCLLPSATILNLEKNNTKKTNLGTSAA